MPSALHEAVLELVRNRPELPAVLARDALGAALPAFARARVREADFTQVVPAEYRADLVVTLETDAAEVGGLVVEHQLSRNDDKRFGWPLYAAALHARIRRPTWLVVIAGSEAVARWAAQPIATFQPCSPFRPLVIGPADVPRVTSLAEARAAPELAVLSERAHGREAGGEEVALAALAAAGGLEEERGKLYADLVLSALGEATRRALEKLMERKYEYQSEFARKYVAQGREEQARSALLRVLARRGVELPPHLAERVAAEKDVARLERWLDEAATATRIEDVFGDS